MTQQPAPLRRPRGPLKSGGDILLAIGSIAAIIGVLVILINLGSVAGTGENILLGLALVIGGLLLDVVAYLKRIAKALENR